MKYLRPFLFAALAVICVTCGYNALGSKNVVCDQTYALCTSASCIPDPNNPSQAVCYCKVHQGKSYGHAGCSKRKPHMDEHGTHFVISTYSFDDAATKEMMTCPKGKPWTDCLDKPCTVDPANPTNAICMCDVHFNEESITWGGNCDKSTCDTGYWSGASLKGNKQAMAYFAKVLGRTPPQNYCE